MGVLYLWHDHWHEAHEIAQAHEGQRDHDLLHGILHRREGDFGNADYWFRSAGLHPCFHLIAARVKGIKEMHPAQAHTLPAQGWDPPTFVEAIRKQKSKAEEGFLRAVQAVEIMTFHEWLERNP